MFDEYFNPLTIAVSPVLVVAEPRVVDIADSPVPTSIDLDAASTSFSSTQEQEHSPVISPGFEESPKTPHFHDDPLHESLHEDSTSHGSLSNVRPSHTPFKHLGRWTKDHPIANVVKIVLWYLDSGCLKHMTGNHSQLMNFVSKFLGTVRFRNDQVAKIMGYGDYQLGNVIISRVYYVEGLGHNLFFVRQFCDADLEVAFQKNTCFIRNLKCVDLLLGYRDTNLYTISLDDMLKTSLICLLSKASKTKRWLWHHRLSHLNFGTLNKLAKDGIARVCLCARYQAKPTEKHLNAIKQIFQYLKGTINIGIWYSKDTGMSLTAYSDVDHAGCQDTRRSTFESAQCLGDKLVSWSSKKQKSTAISSAEAEYIALSGNMNPVIAKQVALNNDLVPPEKRLKIKKCNARIEFRNPQREETYQVTLDALKLSLCYPVFLITVKVPEVYMHQFWNAIQKIKDTDAYWFKLDKKKYFMFQVENKEISSARKEYMPYPRFTKVIINLFISKDKTISMRNMINLHTVCDDTLLGTLKFVSKTHDYQQYGALIPNEMINQDIKDYKAYKTYLDFATRKATPKKAKKFKKVVSPSRKFLILEEEPEEKTKRAKKLAKKSTSVPIAGVVIKDTPSEYVPKKKTPAKVDRGKGMDLLSNVALLEAAQLKKTLKKSTLETYKLHASGLGVPDVPKYLSKSEKEYWGDIGDDDDSDEVTKDDDDVDSYVDDEKVASDNEKTNSDEDMNPNLNQNDDEEEEYEEEYVRTPDSVEFTNDDEEYEELYKDVNISLQDTEHQEEWKGDAEMTNVGRDESTQQTTYEKIKDDEHVILTTVHDIQKTEVPLQSSHDSSDFANHFLNLDNVSPIDTEVVFMMNVKVFHDEPSTLTPPLLNIHVM
nr:uncharacterized mitochondrial protein AtMg00810-like [Tanacetum cinerariifolium]